MQKVLLVLCVVALTQCAAADIDTGKTQDRPARIIAIGGSITEIIYALGGEARLVAVDSTSMYPAAALAQHPSVGYMRTLSAEPILSVNPDLILAVDDAGPPAALEQLRTAGVRVLNIPDEPSMAGVFTKIRHIAEVLGLEARGAELISKLDAEYQSLLRTLNRVETRPEVLFLLSVGRGAALAAGGDTSAHSMISLAGGNNVMQQLSGYKPVTPEAIITAAPQVIVALRRTLARYDDKETFFSQPELAATPAARQGRLATFDALYLIGFGPRTVRAVRELAAEFHPDLFDSRHTQSERLP